MVEATLSSTFSNPANPGNTNDSNNSKEEAPKKPSSVAIFQDAITINIPINVTADLGVAIRRTRTKRIEALYQAYPELKQKDESGKDEEEEEEDDEDEEEEESAENTEEDGGEPKKKKKKTTKDDKKPKKQSGLVPQRHEFGSIMDYLEAKYVRGVMIQNEKDTSTKEGGEDGADGQGKKEEDEDDEGQGSVYSESSFLDDRDLQRDVAEQVLAQTTTTKLELEGDDDFFVNVGDLDVEETELTQQHYDPLEDSPKKTKPATKKRKKPSGDSAAAKKTAASPPAKKKAAVTKKKKSTADDKDKGKGKDSVNSSKPKPKKKVKVVKKAKTKEEEKPKEKQKEKDDGNESDSSSSPGAVAVAASNKKVPKKAPEEMKALKAEADKHRAIMQKRFDTVKKMIKELTKEQLPRRPPLKSKVSITCPASKKEGEEVTFANPHIPGQRLRVQVPKGTMPGETFKVTVPVPKPSAGDDDDGVDHNKFPRSLQDELDMYAREYDVFCKHEGEYKHALDEEYPIHLEKRKKYDRVVKEFPKNLMTPIDSEYMKKLVRRARQNKSKRSKSAAVRRQSGDAAAASPAPQPDKALSSAPPPAPAPVPAPAPEVPSDKEEEAPDQQSDAEEEEPPAPEPPTHRTIELPQRGFAFPEKQFSNLDFFQGGPAAGGAPNQS